MVTANVNDDPNDEVIIDFGNENGIWIYYPDRAYRGGDPWERLHPSSSDHLIVAADVDGDGVDEIVFDFGAVDGLWIWDPNWDPNGKDDGPWTRLHTSSAESIVK